MDIFVHDANATPGSARNLLGSDLRGACPANARPYAVGYSTLDRIDRRALSELANTYFITEEHFSADDRACEPSISLPASSAKYAMPECIEDENTPPAAAFQRQSLAKRHGWNPRIRAVLIEAKEQGLTTAEISRIPEIKALPFTKVDIAATFWNLRNQGFLTREGVNPRAKLPLNQAERDEILALRAANVRASTIKRLPAFKDRSLTIKQIQKVFEIEDRKLKRA